MYNQALETIEEWDKVLRETLEPIYEIDDKPFEYGERKFLIQINREYEINLFDTANKERCMEIAKVDEDGNDMAYADVSWRVDELEDSVVFETEEEEMLWADELLKEAIEYTKDLISNGAKCEEMDYHKRAVVIKINK